MAKQPIHVFSIVDNHGGFPRLIPSGQEYENEKVLGEVSLHSNFAAKAEILLMKEDGGSLERCQNTILSKYGFSDVWVRAHWGGVRIVK